MVVIIMFIIIIIAFIIIFTAFILTTQFGADARLTAKYCRAIYAVTDLKDLSNIIRVFFANSEMFVNIWWWY